MKGATHIWVLFNSVINTVIISIRLFRLTYCLGLVGFSPFIYLLIFFLHSSEVSMLQNGDFLVFSIVEITLLLMDLEMKITGKVTGGSQVLKVGPA